MPSETIQWFPGHMAKTRRMITENLSQVDIVFELLDARIPYSSQNPEIPRLTSAKPRLTLLSKSSLADAEVSEKWKKYFSDKGRECIFYDVRTGEGIDKIAPASRRLCAEKLRRDEEKGMTRPIRAMIVGIPNVGKSSLINRLAADKKAKVENRPGVTLSQAVDERAFADVWYSDNHRAKRARHSFLLVFCELFGAKAGRRGRYFVDALARPDVVEYALAAAHFKCLFPRLDQRGVGKRRF